MTAICGPGWTGWVESVFTDCVNKPLSAGELLEVLKGDSKGARALKRVADADRTLTLNMLLDESTLQDLFEDEGGAVAADDAKWLMQQGLMALPGLVSGEEKAVILKDGGVYGDTTVKVIRRLIENTGLQNVDLFSVSCMNVMAPRPKANGKEYNYLVHAALVKALEAASKGGDWEKEISGMFDSKEKILAYQQSAKITGHMSLDLKHWFLVRENQ